MATNDFRQNNNRHSERRSKERRESTFLFGSADWLNAIKQEYLLWPKQDRRHQDRRQGFRRIKNLGRSRSSVDTKKLKNLLTDEEKKMLNELSRPDDTE